MSHVSQMTRQRSGSPTLAKNSSSMVACRRPNVRGCVSEGGSSLRQRFEDTHPGEEQQPAAACMDGTVVLKCVGVCCFLCNSAAQQASGAAHIDISGMLIGAPLLQRRISACFRCIELSTGSQLFLRDCVNTGSQEHARVKLTWRRAAFSPCSEWPDFSRSRTLDCGTGPSDEVDATDTCSRGSFQCTMGRPASSSIGHANAG